MVVRNKLTYTQELSERKSSLVDLVRVVTTFSPDCGVCGLSCSYRGLNSEKAIGIRRDSTTR